MGRYRRVELKRGLQCFFEKPDSAGEVDLAGRNVLSRVVYGRGSQMSLRDDVPLLDIHMVGADAEPFTEVWTTDRPVRSGVEGGLIYAEDGEYIFCAMHVDEQRTYRDRVRAAYEEAFALVWRLGYTELFRMWNIVGAITGNNAEGMENYRDFCIGRAGAFEEWSGRIGRMPAATGIGSLSSGIDMYFLACRQGSVRHMENPRQTPAYKYPEKYGPKSPSFARATYLKCADGEPDTVYVSGTASIVGDDTVHINDIHGQCDVTLANIEALISHENLERHGVDGGFALKDLDFIKVYVRDAEHMPAVRAKCTEVFPAHAEVSFLNVGICRPDLLVEIEGICR